MSAITLRCLIDGCVLPSSTLWGEHGVAFLVETPAGQLLFDTGQSGEVLLHNARAMGIALDRLDALALSHAHYDHTGGLPHFLEHSRPHLPLYAHPDIFQARYARRGGATISIGLPLTRAALAARADLRLSAEPAEILPGVWTTGEIRARPEFEGRSAPHGIVAEGEWQADPYRDDLALVLETGAGLVVVCGCGHAGLLNILAQVRRGWGGKIRAVIGGLHLASLSREALLAAMERLHEINEETLPQLYLNHCTGEQAYRVLAQALGEKVRACPAGTVLNF